MIIKDDRTEQEKADTIAFVVATDRFMSGWGQAQRRSIVARPVRSHEEMFRIERLFLERSEFLRVRICLRSYKPKLYDGDHLHIYGMDSFNYTDAS